MLQSAVVSGEPDQQNGQDQQPVFASQHLTHQPDQDHQEEQEI